MPDLPGSPEPFLEKRLTSENLRHNIGLRRFTGVTMLNRQSYELSLGLEHLRALDLTEHSALHATLLLRDDVIRERAYSMLASTKPPIAVMVATPMPPETWGNAMRICFTLKSERGQLYQLIRALRKMHLYVRHVDSGDGLGLNDFKIVGPGLHLYDLETSDETRSAIRPTTVLTIEVPRKEYVDNIRDGEEPPAFDVELLRSIHKYLDAWKIACSKDHAKNYEETLKLKRKMVANMHKALEKFASENHQAKWSSARIEWVSPLQMLASLRDAVDKCEKTEGADLSDDPKKTTVRDASQYLPIVTSSHDRRGLSVSLDCWKKYLDPTARNSIERSLSPGLTNFAAVLTADREERTLTAEFLSLKHYAVLQFEIIYPTGRMGHRWKEWMLQIISEERGGVLRAFSMGRVEGRWGREVVIAWFPFTKPAERACSDLANKQPVDADETGISTGRSDESRVDEEDQPHPDADAIRRIINCVRRLKGFSRAGNLAEKNLCSASEELEKHIDGKRRDVAKEVLEEKDVDASTKMLYRKDSTLHGVKLWYRWPELTTLRHRSEFQKNPFNFTRPLTYDEYGALYQLNILDKRMSRLRLANRICQRLTDDEDGSVILVGAHRSGKTSVMNMVLDMLSSELGVPDEERNDMIGLPNPEDKVVGIRINAAVTPAHQFVLAIIRELELVKTEKQSKLRRAAHEAATTIHDAIFNTAKETLKFAMPTSWAIKFKFLNFEADVARDEQPKADNVDTALRADDLASALAQRERDGLWDTPEGQAAFLRLSIDCLREAMGTLKDEKLKLVVAVDEISESAAWGNALAFPVWRHLIESQNFRDVRWLFSSTRPPTDATGYSPLSNALREYTMRPLNKSEAYQLIDNFDHSGRESLKGRIPLVVTFGAREFIVWATGQFPYLIQVTCVYVFEKAIGYHIPVITSSLVRKILRDTITSSLTEYFEAQWSGLPDDCQQALLEAVKTIEHPLGRPGYDLPIHNISLNPQTARKVQMAGLGWHGGSNSVAPLFAHWLSISRT